MLGLFKGKNKGNLLHSPCNGKVVPITEVPDSTFADKLEIIINKSLSDESKHAEKSLTMINERR